MCSGILFICQNNNNNNNNNDCSPLRECCHNFFFHHYYGDFRNIIDWIGLPTAREPRIIWYIVATFFFPLPSYLHYCKKCVSASVIIIVLYTLYTSAEALRISL
jgi:hypothetical protein